MSSCCCWWCTWLSPLVPYWAEERTYGQCVSKLCNLISLLSSFLYVLMIHHFLAGETRAISLSLTLWLSFFQLPDRLNPLDCRLIYLYLYEPVALSFFSIDLWSIISLLLAVVFCVITGHKHWRRSLYYGDDWARLWLSVHTFLLFFV